MLQFAVICLAFVFSIVFPIHAQQFKLDGGKKRDIIDFIKVKNLIVIPVFINNKGPYNFLLDTGVSQMIITDTTFIDLLHIEKKRIVKIQGYGFGKEIEAILTREINARIGKSTMINIPAAIFKEDIFDLSSYLGLKIYGILGYQFFSSFVVKLNYNADKITFYNPDYNIKKKGSKIPLRIVNGKPYLDAEITTPTLQKIPIELLVDNGSSHPLMLESLKNQAFPLPSITITANLGVGINGQISGHMGRMAFLKIQNFVFKDIISGFPEFKRERTDIEKVPRNGSLGAEVLKHFLVTFDYKNEAIYLKKTPNFSKKFDHDMSGLEIFVKQDPNDRYFISRVEPGSPAEEVGLYEDDEIISIDFKRMEYYNLNDLTELFRDQDGKQLIIEIQRNHIRKMFILKLKRRI